MSSVSIDLRKLTSLTCGSDSTTEGDHSNPAVLKQVEYVAKKCRVKEVPVTVTGPVSEELVERLNEWGVTSVVASPNHFERLNPNV